MTNNEASYVCQESLSAVTGSDAVKEVVGVLGDALVAGPDNAGVKVDTAHLCNRTQEFKA